MFIIKLSGYVKLIADKIQYMYMCRIYRFPIVNTVIYMLIGVYFLLQEKPKMGTMESLKFLVSSRYIRDLATLVVAYGISINLVEVTWKSKLKAQVN
jgi:ATP/ADP translocase